MVQAFKWHAYTVVDDAYAVVDDACLDAAPRQSCMHTVQRC